MLLKPHLVRSLRDLGETGMTVPAGTQGFHIGIRTHFDLGAVLAGGNWTLPNLPVYDQLVMGEDIEDLGEWDGSTEGFTEQGLRLAPLIGFLGNRRTR